MAQCPNPVFIKSNGIFVPCSRCLDCRKRRASSWGFRLNREGRAAKSAFFLTLTYDSDHIRFTQNGFMTLWKPDVVNWLKTIRKTCERQNLKEAKQNNVKNDAPSIKYYQVGEYGGKRHRPHYHLIIFNVPLEILIGKKMADYALNNRDRCLRGKMHFNSKYWPHGTITVGTVSGASINYTLKYISKSKYRPQHKRDDRQPEFACMSKGIGLNYLTPQVIKWHKDWGSERYYVTGEGGVKMALPRYYKNRIWTPEEREKIGLELMAMEEERTSKLSAKLQMAETELLRKKALYNRNFDLNFASSNDTL